MHEIFIEAESFQKLGGWAVDQQSMQTLHSSYILAHGLGVPVTDAQTEFSVARRVLCLGVDARLDGRVGCARRRKI